MQSDLPSSSLPAPRDDTKALLLNRLARLIRLRQDHEKDLNSLGVELLERSIYATYRDCIDFGASEEARLLMVQARLRPEAHQK